MAIYNKYPGVDSNNMFPPGVGWDRGQLREGDAFDLLPGVYNVGNMTAVENIANLPEQYPGILTVQRSSVSNIGGLMYQPYSRLYTWYTTTQAFHPNYAPWWKIDPAKFWDKGQLREGDVFDLPPGVYNIGSMTAVEGISNLPEQWPGILLVEKSEVSRIGSLTYRPHQRNYVYFSNSAGFDTVYGPWWKVGENAETGGGQDLGLLHKVQRDFFLRRRGGKIGTGGLPVVSIRFDHGLMNLRDKVLPHLARLGLPSSTAMNSARWDHTETGDVTPEDLNKWAVDYGMEIWNHGQTHGDASNLSDLTREIVTGKEELQAQTPSAPIEGWVVPGVGGTGYGGFSAGQNPERWDTIAGRLILGHHAVSTSHISGTMAPLSGDTTVISNHSGLDSATASQGITRLNDLVNIGTGGMVLFLHPSQLDQPDRITTTHFVQILEHLASLRDQGKIRVLTMGGMAVADQGLISRPRYSSLLNAMTPASVSSGGSTSRVIGLGTYLGWAKGGVREIVVDLTLSSAGRVRVSTSDADYVEYNLPSGSNTIVRPVMIPLGATELRVTVSFVNSGGVVQQIQDYPI